MGTYIHEVCSQADRCVGEEAGREVWIKYCKNLKERKTLFIWGPGKVLLKRRI